MSTPTIEQMHRHYSVRRYTPDPVPRDLVETVVDAGQRASTSSNLQAYSVVAVTAVDRRAALAELCGDQEGILQAPVFLAWCADLSRLDRVCRMRGYEQEATRVESFLVAVIDAALAMQNAALAAESLGLGMCYIGAIRNHPAEVIELLELPRLVFPISGMTLGWPAVQPLLKPRLPLEAVLHWERYDTAGEAEALAAYDQAMIATGIYHGRQVPVPGGEGEMEEYGWMEHSARRVSQPVRVHLQRVLAAQGFALE
ncbi:MAG TPA: NADPH-dependent oxidoreductase [Anaerolineae bacterium]|nr:NADPH-dependent oxidoreductase [Anaerolineae bacterium]